MASVQALLSPVSWPHAVQWLNVSTSCLYISYAELSFIHLVMKSFGLHSVRIQPSHFNYLCVLPPPIICLQQLKWHSLAPQNLKRRQKMQALKACVSSLLSCSSISQYVDSHLLSSKWKHKVKFSQGTRDPLRLQLQISKDLQTLSWEIWMKWERSLTWKQKLWIHISALTCIASGPRIFTL